MKKRTIPSICLALSLLLIGCGAKAATEAMDPTISVETAVAQTDTLSISSTYIGTVSAEGTASVVAMVSGTVEELAVSAGDTVNAGDLLCRLDDESALLALRSAQAAAFQANVSVVLSNAPSTASFRAIHI